MYIYFGPEHPIFLNNNIWCLYSGVLKPIFKISSSVREIVIFQNDLSWKNTRFEQKSGVYLGQQSKNIKHYYLGILGWKAAYRYIYGAEHT